MVNDSETIKKIIVNNDIVGKNSLLFDCSENCKKLSTKFFKINFIDRLIGRTINDKIESHCHLNCLRNLELNNIKRNGRWAFECIFGFTEFFSSFFALMSLYLNLKGYNKIKSKLRKSPLGTAIKLHLCSANVAFLSSFLFHLHETTITRNADYFSAIFSIFSGTALGILRIILIYFPKKFKSYNKRIMIILGVWYILHVYYMVFVDFDYVYNKIVCGFMFILMFTCHIITYFYYRHRPISTHIVMWLNCLIMACLFEMSDIPPVFYVVDSHAMWHFFGLLSVPSFLEFTSQDVDCHLRLMRLKNKNKNK